MTSKPVYSKLEFQRHSSFRSQCSDEDPCSPWQRKLFINKAKKNRERELFRMREINEETEITHELAQRRLTKLQTQHFDVNKLRSECASIINNLGWVLESDQRQ